MDYLQTSKNLEKFNFIKYVTITKSETGSELIKIVTHFKFINGEDIGFVLEEQADTLVLSDYGRTFDYLEECGIRSYHKFREKNGREYFGGLSILDYVVTELKRYDHVFFEASSLMIDFPRDSRRDIDPLLAEMVLELVNACIFVNNLSLVWNKITEDE